MRNMSLEEARDLPSIWENLPEAEPVDCSLSEIWKLKAVGVSQPLSGP